MPLYADLKSIDCLLLGVSLTMPNPSSLKFAPTLRFFWTLGFSEVPATVVETSDIVPVVVHVFSFVLLAFLA